MPEIELPDGSVVEFPEGMPTNIMTSVINRHSMPGQLLHSIMNPKALEPYRETASEIAKDILPVSSQIRSIDRIQEAYGQIGKGTPIGDILRAADIALEGLGLSADVVPFAKAGAIAASSLLPMMIRRVDKIPGVMKSQAGQTGYHGSPHKFDKFKTSQIGTGEGAQAYGHGIYIAENPGVAKEYQIALSRAARTGDDGQDLANYMLSSKRGDNDKAIKSLSSEIDGYNKSGWPSPEYRNQYDSALDILNKNGAEYSGNLYEVDIPDEKIAQMLDWDAPLSEQPEGVKKILPQIIESTKKSFPSLNVDEMTGGSLYQAYTSHRGGTTQFASETLKELGIPGIKYYDQGSRTAGKGTRNFVVFDENDMNILKRNDEQIVRKGSGVEVPKGFELAGEGMLGRGAIKLKDGRVLVDDSAVHAQQINKLNKIGIGTDQIESGGFIRADGSYIEGSANAPGLLAQEMAKRKVAERLKRVK